VQKSHNGSGQTNTEAKQRSLANLRPFKKGDKRINRNGRPRSFDAVHLLAQKLARERLSSGELAITDLLRSWRDSHEPVLQKAFVEYAFGKVPDKIESTIDDRRTLHLHWPHERPDLATNGNGHERN